MQRAGDEPQQEDRDDWRPSSYRDDVDEMSASLKDDLEVEWTLRAVQVEEFMYGPSPVRKVFRSD